MPICNEDVATVFAGLRATCESLAVTGVLSLFDIYLLSDSADPAVRAAEQRAWQRLRQTLQRIDVLPSGLRDAIRLRVLHDQSTEQVCQALQISEENLFVRLHRARKQLLS